MRYYFLWYHTCVFLIPESDLKRVATVYAMSYCYLYTLTLEDFNKIVAKFPVSANLDTNLALRAILRTY